MGAFGGLIGALFNYMNIQLTKFRNVYVKKRISTLLECVIVASCSAIIGFLLSYYVRDDCQPIGRDLVSKYPVQLFCDDGQYNAMSGLWFQTPEKSVRSLFHDPPGSFNPITLLIFCATYYFLAIWTYGLAIPSGLFIPSLLIGAAWGRLFGIGINTLFPTASVNPGKYALIGAASTLGGILRMTLSLTVIVTEATGDISLGLPIMFAIMAAKLVGDLFNEGIFDMHIALAGIPLLDWEPPSMTQKLSAQHVMTFPVVVLREKETVGRIMNILQNTKHNGFPVVDGYEPDAKVVDNFGLLKGFILRHQLLTLLKKKCYLFDSYLLTPEDFKECYPRYLNLKDIHLREDEMDRELDLRPYMNLSPYTVTENSNLPRMFRLFRGLGLRHLIVVDEHNNVIGIVTRIDLAKYKTHVGFKHAFVKELSITT
jgi:chloride channel 7